MDLRDQLQASLGAAYLIERELGGGGMSRVFVAEETSLRRRVVVKVLSPGLAAGVNVDRFQREIQLAAALQHPHIVPVHAAGDTNGLPYYTMPLVEGESLRARITRGALPLDEATEILRDVAMALGYAHERGIVHRDIKPENVLLSGGAAVVTDFGIAKALSAAKTEAPNATLTQVGTSLGTPMYMAPEQAAGDPGTDHRADLYAFGVMAYELLAGRPPFDGTSPHKLITAHMREAPRPVHELRPDVPAQLAAMVMRCLEKEPGARPSNATEVLAALTQPATTTGQLALPAALLGGAGAWKKALGIYAAAFLAVAVLARAAIIGIGLPDWVFPGALLVMGLGLPVILATAYVQHLVRRSLLSSPTLTPGGSRAAQSTLTGIALKASPHMSWGRTMFGGLIAVGAFIALTATWMVLRAMGIGPAGTLMAAGELGARERIIVAEFKGPPGDSLLAPTVTEALRTGLAQSTNLSILSATAIADVLGRMQRAPGSAVLFPVAREIATREGIKVVVDGQIAALGGSYLLSARLVRASDGEELATFSQTADEARDIIPAIGRLSKAIRSKVGESLRTIQRQDELARVTTSSLDALKKYVEAIRVLGAGDNRRGEALLKEAIAIDTTLSMAYRKLAGEIFNRGGPRSEMQAYIQKAYDHRDRLTEIERYATIAGYFRYGPTPDPEKTIAAHESALAVDPADFTSLNIIALTLRETRRSARAESLAMRAIAADSTAWQGYANLVISRLNVGKRREAEEAAAAMTRALPAHPWTLLMRGTSLLAREAYDTAEQVLATGRGTPNLTGSSTPFWATTLSSSVMAVQGRLARARAWSDSSRHDLEQAGDARGPVNAAITGAIANVWFGGDREATRRALDRVVIEHPIDSLPLQDRPYEGLADAYSLLGAVDKAKRAAASLTQRYRAQPSADEAQGVHLANGHVALAERRYTDAVAEYRAADVGACTVCALPALARAYDLAEQRDSAIAVFERYLATPYWFRVVTDARFLAGSHKRLGELYEARNDREKALSHYSRFVELWKDADPELQPQVHDVRQRLARLQRSKG